MGGGGERGEGRGERGGRDRRERRRGDEEWLCIPICNDADHSLLWRAGDGAPGRTGTLQDMLRAPHTTAEHNVRSGRLQRGPVCKPATHTFPTHSRLTKTDLTTDINTTVYPQTNLLVKTDLTTDFDTTLYPQTNLLTKTDLTADFNTTPYPQTKRLKKTDLATDFNAISHVD